MNLGGFALFDAGDELLVNVGRALLHRHKLTLKSLELFIGDTH